MQEQAIFLTLDKKLVVKRILIKAITVFAYTPPACFIKLMECSAGPWWIITRDWITSSPNLQLMTWTHFLYWLWLWRDCSVKESWCTELLLPVSTQTKLWITGCEICLFGCVWCSREGSWDTDEFWVLSQPALGSLVAPQHSSEHWKRSQILHPTHPLANQSFQKFILWFFLQSQTSDCLEKPYLVCNYSPGVLQPQPHGGPASPVLTPEHLNLFFLTFYSSTISLFFPLQFSSRKWLQVDILKPHQESFIPWKPLRSPRFLATLLLSHFGEAQVKLTNHHQRWGVENQAINHPQRAYSSMKKPIRGKVDLSEAQHEVPLWQEKLPRFNAVSSETT